MKKDKKKNGYSSTLPEKARLGLWRSASLRKRATPAEKALLSALTEKGYWLKFQPYFYTETHLYIPDFRLAMKREKLIIEVDGPIHQRQTSYDADRTAWLQENRNCVVLRFTNEEVLTNIEHVLSIIDSYEPLKLFGQGHTPSKKQLAAMRQREMMAQDTDPAEQFKQH